MTRAFCRLYKGSFMIKVQKSFLTFICVTPCIFVILSFIANKCTSLILLLYVTLQSHRHVSIRVDHHRGIGTVSQ
jgi:hypothetical protein